MSRHQTRATHRVLIAVLAVATMTLATPPAGADGAREVAERVADWRGAHERPILAELTELLAIPNVAADRANIRRNADALVTLLERRGARAEILENEPGPPAVFAELPAPGATRTVVFYAHFDGQPVDPEEWTTPPWEPTLRDGALSEGSKVVDLSGYEGPIGGDWRIYGRSASDDKGPIIALVAALDALRALEIPLSVKIWHNTVATASSLGHKMMGTAKEVGEWTEKNVFQPIVASLGVALPSLNYQAHEDAMEDDSARAVEEHIKKEKPKKEEEKARKKGDKERKKTTKKKSKRETSKEPVPSS